MLVTDQTGDGPVFEVRRAAKHFGGITALQDGSLTLYPGEIHAIVGDNGAGKSTLIKIMSGVFPPDAGTLMMNGESVDISSPRAAHGLGIAVVYQELALVDHLDVSANLFLGRELFLPTPLCWFGFLAKRRMRREAQEEIRRLKIGIRSVDQRLRGMSGGQRQAVAVARVVAFGTRIAIMDEPTAALGVTESEAVLRLIAELRSHGLAVVMVSHNLRDVFSVADRITVMRLGRTIATLPRNETDPEEVVSLITGAKEC
jgi:ABC-type sugar transport system ATPase subunit